MSDKPTMLDALVESLARERDVNWKDATDRATSDEDRDRIHSLRDVAHIAAFSQQQQRASAATPNEPALEVWGEFRLLERIGNGAYAEVFRAWDPALQRDVALKLLHPVLAEADDSRLFAEGRAAARVRHPNVIAVHGIDRHAGRVGLWMDLMKGPTLEQLVERRGPLAADQVRQLGIEIGSALAAVHDAGFLHRDIKPANVMIDGEGRFVLADFGLGLRQTAVPDPGAALSGTPMYMAPECLAGEPPTERSDVYALGLLMWFARAGRHPYAARTLAELGACVKAGPPSSLREVRGDTPSELAQTIERATAQDPARRTSGARELMTALASPARTIRPRTRRVAAVLAGVAAVLAVVVIVVLRGRSERAEQITPGIGAPVALAVPFDVEAALQRYRPDGAETLAPGDRVRPGDRLLLRVRASRPVWAYVLNEDERGERYLLFPQPLYDRRNPLPPDSSWVLPGTVGGRDQGWTVTSRGGREHFLVVVSPEPVAELESEMSRLPAPLPGRPIQYAAVGDAAVERLRGTGGLAALPAPSAVQARPFERFRTLAARETGVRGIWVRQVVLDNP